MNDSPPPPPEASSAASGRTVGLRLRGVRCAHGSTVAVDDASMVIESGHVHGLLGPSGCGKTTLLRAIVGLHALQAGTIDLEGVALADADRGLDRPTEQRRVGLLLQEGALFPHLRVIDNVAFGLSGSRRQRRELATQWLRTVGLAERAAAWPHELSGGEAQRVALARALAPRPAAVLLDEPFASLDPDRRRSLGEVTLRILREARLPTLLVTHDPQEAMASCQTLSLMLDGRIVQSGPPRELYARPVSLRSAQLLGPINTLAGNVRGGRLQTALGSTAVDLPEGEHATQAFRPEAITVQRHDDEHGDKGGVVATVERSVCQGIRTELTVRLPSGESLLAIDGRPDAFHVGERVHLHLEAGAATIWPPAASS